MDLLKNEIAKKRKEMEDLKLLNDSKKKYYKRSELEEKQSQMLMEKLNAAKESDQVKIDQTEKDRMEKHEKSKHAKCKDDETVEKKMLPRVDVIRRLRDRGHPIRLFGETDEDSAKRLNIIESRETSSFGMRNDFKTAMDKSEQESLNEIMNSIDGEHHSEQHANAEQDELDDESFIDEITKMVEIKDDRNNDSMLVVKFFKVRCSLDDIVIGLARFPYMCVFWFKYILKKWTAELNNRPLADKLKISGKIDAALHGQTVSYLKPLFRKLKTKSLAEDILDSLVKMVYQLVDRNYIKANEYFLEMAIGNSPWPIGATMVGIHARPGRERIASKHVAHVLNDETQRKYIQAIKRLMSKCQQYFKTDPSRCVEYGLKNENITIIPGGK